MEIDLLGFCPSMAQGTICRCCGERMVGHQDISNPNICRSCAQLLDDETPIANAREVALEPDFTAMANVKKAGSQSAPASVK